MPADPLETLVVREKLSGRSMEIECLTERFLVRDASRPGCATRRQTGPGYRRGSGDRARHTGGFAGRTDDGVGASGRDFRVGCPRGREYYLLITIYFVSKGAVWRGFHRKSETARTGEVQAVRSDLDERRDDRFRLWRTSGGGNTRCQRGWRPVWRSKPVRAW